jgi:hypothetical protein
MSKKEATNMMCIASCNDFSKDSFRGAVEYLLEAIIKSEPEPSQRNDGRIESQEQNDRPPRNTNE